MSLSASNHNDRLEGGHYTGNEGWNGAVFVGEDGDDILFGSTTEGSEGWNGDVLVGGPAQTS